MPRVVAIIMVLTVLASACGSDTDSTDTAPTSETPAQSVTATPQATQESTTTRGSEPANTSEPTPETPPRPTPILVSGICPDDRDEAGLAYEYDSAAVSESDAVEKHCGTLAPVTATCPHSSHHYGKEIQYDPDDLTDYRQVEAEFCGGNCGIEGCGESGPYAPGFRCAWDRENANWYFEYDASEMTYEEAEDEYCGRLISCERISNTVKRQLMRGASILQGNCYTENILIWQFDANTGPCSFLGYFSHSRRYGGEIDTLSQYGYTDDPYAQWAIQVCPELNTVFADDFIVVDAVYLGTYSYETQGGGSNTVQAFRILRVG